jgi:hypothetical protein
MTGISFETTLVERAAFSGRVRAATFSAAVVSWTESRHAKRMLDSLDENMVEDEFMGIMKWRA